MPNLRPFSPEDARNPQTNPFHTVKMVPKLGKPTDNNQNLSDSEGGLNVSACQFSIRQCVLQKMHGNLKFDPFH